MAVQHLRCRSNVPAGSPARVVAAVVCCCLGWAGLVGVEAVQLLAFGCDTSNASAATARPPFFYSAVRLALLRGPNCSFAGPAADALGPCFVSPAAVKSQLDTLPAGSRAISLEGESLYTLQDASGADVFRDPLPDGALSPWMDGYVTAVGARFEQWFTAFADIGGQVDVVLGDFEMGGAVYWYTMSELNASSVQLLVQDPRWAATKAQLDAVGAPLNASFDDNLTSIKQWQGYAAPPFTDWRAWTWDQVLVDRGVGAALNRSVFEPIARHFPAVHFSNFAHHYHSDTSLQQQQQQQQHHHQQHSAAAAATAAVPVPVPWWPWMSNSGVSCSGTGSHAGTHQSTSFYGGEPWQNYTLQVLTQRHDRIWATSPTPFNALVQEAAKARDMAAAAPGVPVHPWLAPRDFVCRDPGMPSGAGSHLYGSLLWSEMVFHVLLATGATEVLWWKPGAMQPPDVGVDLLVATLRELQLLLNGGGGEGGAGGGCDTPEPLATPATAVSDWAQNYLLSGARCGGRAVYRFTPRCVNTPPNVFCVSGPPAPAANGTEATFKIGSGFSITPVPGGRIVQPAAPVSGGAGWWVVAEEEEAQEDETL